MHTTFNPARDPETRSYPFTCRSSSCARTSCNGCPFLEVLEEFKAWRDDCAAVRLDVTWSPGVWTATR